MLGHLLPALDLEIVKENMACSERRQESSVHGMSDTSTLSHVFLTSLNETCLVIAGPDSSSM